MPCSFFFCSSAACAALVPAARRPIRTPVPTPTVAARTAPTTTRRISDLPARVRPGILASDIHQLLQHLIRGGDDARAGLKPALGEDHVGKLLGQVDVGRLELPAAD